MSNLLLILKTTAINNLGINKITKETNKKEKYKTLSLFLIPIIAMLVLAVSIYEMLMPIADVLVQFNQIEVLLYLAIVGAVSSSLFTCLYKAQGYLFASKDYELLMSLPVKPTSILASKLIYLTIVNYVFTSFLVFPPAIVYFIKVKPHFIFIINLLIMFLVMSFVPIVLASIIVFVLGKVSSKTRFKNAFLIILSLAATILAIGISYNMEGIITNLVQNSESIAAAIKQIYFPAYYFVDALVNYNFVSMLIFIASSVVPLIAFIYVFAKGFRKINASMSESYKKANYKMKTLKQSSQTKALLMKEIKRYFSSYIYVLNTSVGMIMLTVASVGALLFGGEKIAMILEIPYAQDMIYQYLLVAVVVFCVLSCTTNSSISLEGKNLWILKSSPIDCMDIFRSKIYLNLLIILPLLFINCGILYFALDLSISQLIIMLSIATLYSIFTAISGLIINLMLPKLEWTSDITVVKQSMAVMVSLGVGALSIAIPIGIYYLFKISNLNLLVSIVGLSLIIVNVTLYSILKTKGKSLFYKL